MVSRYTSKTVFVFTYLSFLCDVYNTSGLGRCPRHTYMKNFNISRFTGQWFEVERSFYLMELASTCMTIDLEENYKGQIEVGIKTVGRWSGMVKEIEGIATTSKRDPSVFLYRVSSKLPNAIARFLPGAGFYQILQTDYNNFAILWTCTSVGLAHTDLIWILGKKRDLDVSVRADIYDLLSKKHIDSERLILSKNNNCTRSEQ